MKVVNSLLEVVKRVKERINNYGEILSKNENATRYVLVDPLLRELGWDVEDPGKVRFEEGQGEGAPDYVLYVEGRKVVAVKVKKLGTKFDEQVLDSGFKYSQQNKIPFFVVTDGDTWTAYEVRELRADKLFTVSISKEEAEEAAVKLLALWYPLVAQKGVKSIGIIEVGEELLKKLQARGLKCPHCGFDKGHWLIRTWKLRWWNVYLYRCLHCERKFRYHVDPEGKRASFVTKSW